MTFGNSPLTLQSPIPVVLLFSLSPQLSTTSQFVNLPPVHSFLNYGPLSQPTPFHIYDVTALGGGNASLVAALPTHEADASAALLECAAKVERGGNSRFAGAIFCVVRTGRSNIEPLLYPSDQKGLFSTPPHQALQLGGLGSRYAAYQQGPV